VRTRTVLTVVGLIAAGTAVLLSPASADNVWELDRAVRSDAVNEAAGIAPSTVEDGLVYLANDGGGTNRVYAVNGDGTIRSVLTLKSAWNVDWEDLSTGPGHTIWVADTGDDTLSRSQVAVYSFVEPTGTAWQPAMTVKTTRYTFTLPAGPRNIEGVMVHPTTGRLSFVTRQADDAQVYLAPTSLSTRKSNPLTAAGRLPVGGVTAAAWAPDGSTFALGTTTRAYVFASLDDATPVAVDLPVTLPPSGALDYDHTGARLLLSHDGASPKVLHTPVPDPQAPPVNEAPTADFTASVADLSASLDSTGSSDADGSIVSRTWSFGDGTTGSGVTPSKDYSTAGTYTVRLTVTDDDGASATATGEVTVTQPDTSLRLGNGCRLTERGLPRDGCGTLFGSSLTNNTDPSSWESQLGDHLGVRRTYYQANQVDGAIRNVRADLAAGRVPWISFKAPLPWSEMAAGAGDAWATDLATRLSDVGGPVYLAIHHEPENDGDITAWTAMQEHLAPLIRAEAPNVAYSIIVTGWNAFYGSNPSLRLAAEYPDTQIDLIGLDVYDKYGNDAGVTTHTDMQKRFYDLLAPFAEAHGAAWGIAETGYTPASSADYPAWVADSYDQMVASGGVALAYWNSTNDATYALDTAEEISYFRDTLHRSPKLPKSS
jgi:PKD repeat protein